MRLQISTRLDDATTSLIVVGEIDLATGPALALRIGEALDTAGSESLVIDLTDVTFVDCAGISVLVRGAKLAGKHGRVYRLRGAQGMPLTVLRLFGLATTL